MIGGIVQKPALLCLLVNAILIAGSPGIYASNLSRSPRDASCPSCSRDSPAALANWDSPSSRVPRLSDAKSTSWYSSKGQSQQSQYRTNPFSADPFNAYYGAARGTSSAEISKAWGAGGREDSDALRFGHVHPDLAPAPASPFYNIEKPNSPVVPLSPLGPASKVPPQLHGSDSSLTLSPFQPLGPASNPSFQPLGPVSNSPFQPLGPASNPPRQPYSTDFRVPFGPGPFRPFGPGPFRPFGPGSHGPFRPYGPGSHGPFGPYGPGSHGPFGPYGPVSKAPFRKLDPYDPADPKVTLVNSGYSNYELPVPPKSIFEDPDTGTSVVYRADKYNDDSDEEDPVPLYPSDYPTKQFDSRVDVFDVGRPEVQLDKTQFFSSPQRIHGWPGTGYGPNNYRLERSKESAITDGLTETQRDQLLVASLGQILADSQEGQPDQIQDPRMAQRLSNFPENQSRNSRMADKLIQPQEKQLRTSSVMQVPETGFAPQDQLSEQNILKIMQQVGTMVANRNTAEEQKRGQQEVQVASDYANKSLDSSRKEEAKEKRDTVDEKKVPVNANDDYSLPEEMTTQTLAMNIKPVA